MSFVNSLPLITRPKPEQLPPSRSLPAMYETLCCRWLPAAYLEQCHSRLGHRFTVYPLDMPPLVFLSRPSDIREILLSDPGSLHPGSGATMIAPLIGERSFMLLEEEEHICGRRTITPAFHQRMVKDQTAMLSESIEREIASWPLNTGIALHPPIRALTLRVILRVIFSDGDDALQQLYKRLIDMLSVTDSIVLQEPKLRYLPGWRATWRSFVKQRGEVDRLIYGLMARRRADGDPHRGDLLDMLLSAVNPDGSSMSDREIRDNLMSIILAGHETTTGELAWAFQLLAHNQHVQDRLLEEIDSGTEEQYLTATINETLRHKPVFLFAIPREVIEPIEIGGWTYRPPAHLMACTYLMHHNPELYPDPHEFRPERFIEEDQQARTWLPWGGGRKHCLGRHFALLEVKAILCEVLRTRRVLPASRHIERPRWRSAILVPHAGGRVILRERST
jgi:cytochrome P450